MTDVLSLARRVPKCQRCHGVGAGPVIAPLALTVSVSSGLAGDAARPPLTARPRRSRGGSLEVSAPPGPDGVRSGMIVFARAKDERNGTPRYTSARVAAPRVARSYRSIPSSKRKSLEF